MVAVSVVAAASASAAVPGWQIGAAKVDTTPPAFDAAQDLQDFPEATGPRTLPRASTTGRACGASRSPTRTPTGRATSPTRTGRCARAEPFCDYNHNGRWDGIYLSGGVNHLAKSVHDPIDARAVAFSDGSEDRRARVGGRAGDLRELHPRGAHAGRGARRPAAAPRDLRPHRRDGRELQPQRELARHGRHLRRSGGPDGSFGAQLGDRRVLHGLARRADGEGRGRRLRRPAGRPRCGRSTSRSRPDLEQEIPQPVPDHRRLPAARRRSTPRCACCRRATRAAIRSSR